MLQHEMKIDNSLCGCGKKVSDCRYRKSVIKKIFDDNIRIDIMGKFRDKSGIGKLKGTG